MAYRESGEAKDLSIDPEELLAAQKRSTRKKIVGVAVAVVLLGGAGASASVIAVQKAKAANELAWDRFATCLVGEPLAAGEKASVRFRNTQLVAMRVPPEKRNLGTSWPSSCSAPAHAVGESFKSSGTTSPLVESTEKLAKALALDTSVSVDLTWLVEKVFADAAEAKLVAKRAAGVDLPPAPATPMTLDSLPKTAKMFGAQLSLSAIRPMPFGDTALSFVVDDKDFAPGPVLCSLAAGASELACTKIPDPAAQLSPGLRLWGTTAEGTKPFVFAGERGKSGIFRSDTGARVVEKLEYGAYGASAFADGSLGYLAWNEKPPSTHFFRIAPDGSKKETNVVLRAESGNPYYASALFWNFIAYKQVRKDAEGIRLVVRPIEGVEVGKPIDVGRIDEVGHIEGGAEEEPHLTACRAKDTTVLRAKGWHNTYVSFFVAGRWTAPVEAPGLRGQLQCRTGEASIIRPWGGMTGAQRFKGGVATTRCTVSGCEERFVDLEQVVGESPDALPRDVKGLKAVDIEGKLLVVWTGGERGGVRMRIEAPAQLANATETVLFEDHLREGTYRVESTLVDMQLLPAPGGAVLLLGTVDGVYAHFVDASGKLRPLATKL